MCKAVDNVGAEDSAEKYRGALQTIDWLRLTNRSFAEWPCVSPNTNVVLILERSPDTRHSECSLFPHPWRLSLSQNASVTGTSEERRMRCKCLEIVAASR